MYVTQLEEGDSYPGFMHKDVIRRKAQDYCTDSMFTPNINGFTCWKGVDKLVQERYVEREALSKRGGNFGQQRDRFFLLPQGEVVAKFLHERDFGGAKVGTLGQLTTGNGHRLGTGTTLAGVELNSSGYAGVMAEICDPGACKYGEVCDDLRIFLEGEESSIGWYGQSKQNRMHLHRVCDGINSMGAYPFTLKHGSTGEGRRRRLTISKDQQTGIPAVDTPAVVTPNFNRAQSSPVTAPRTPSSASSTFRQLSLGSPSPRKRRFGEINLVDDTANGCAIQRSHSTPGMMAALAAERRARASRLTSLAEETTISLISPEDSPVSDIIGVDEITGKSDEIWLSEDDQQITVCLVVDRNERLKNDDRMHIFNRLSEIVRGAPLRGKRTLAVEHQTLALGDYLWAARLGTEIHDDLSFKEARVLGCLVERKRVNDLVQRSFMKDHERQLRKMKCMKEKVPLQFLIIEGDPSVASECIVFGSGPRPDPRTSICDERGVYRLELKLIFDLDHGMKVLITPNEERTFSALWCLTKKLAESDKISSIRKRSSSAGCYPSFQEFSQQCRALSRNMPNSPTSSRTNCTGSERLEPLRPEEDGITCYTISRALLVRVKGHSFVEAVAQSEETHLESVDAAKTWIRSIIGRHFDKEVVDFYEVKILLIDGPWRGIQTFNHRRRNSQHSTIHLDETVMDWIITMIADEGVNVHLSPSAKHTDIFLNTIEDYFMLERNQDQHVWSHDSLLGEKGTSSKEEIQGETSDNEVIDFTVGWDCKKCTFHNQGDENDCCEMCGSPLVEN